ncbi:TPA: hypothetical protein ACL9NK_004542 [Klebsiella pneumoniae]
MNDKISQDTINKALWAACDTFRGTISAEALLQIVGGDKLIIPFC